MRVPSILVVSLLVTTLPAAAIAKTRTLGIVYAADTSCPDERTFVALAHERVREWPDAASSPDLVARVEAREDAEGYVGRLSLEDSGRASIGTREIREARCDDVVLALAVFLAVALEASLSKSPPTNTPPTSENADAPAQPSARTAEQAPRISTPPKPARTRAIPWYVSAAAQMFSGRTALVAPGASLALEVRGTTPVAPFGALGVEAVPYSRVSRGRGHVKFGWTAVTAGLCVALGGPRQGDRAHPWEPWVCARGELGGLRASSDGYDVDRTRTRLWLSAGGQIGLGYWVDPRVALTAAGGLGFPIIRQTFALSAEPLFESPALTAELGIGVRWQIW